MKCRLPLRIVSIVVVGFCFGLAGCTRTPEAPAAAPMVVTVSYPVEREVTDYAEFTGRTEAVEMVQVQARVNGYLKKILFKEGAKVKEGDILFEIDPRPYQAQLDKDLAQKKQAEAKVKLATADFARAESLLKKSAIAQSEFDTAVANKEVANADVASAKANIEASTLNLDYCSIRSPINGRISNYFKTVGNLVTQDQTLLTTIVSADPIYVYFAVDEHTVLRVKKLIKEGKAKSATEVKLPVKLGLANEGGHPHQGTVNFVDNTVNPKTGTLKVRGVFPNKDEMLVPGLFARVRVPIGQPHPALLVTDRAIDNDQGQKILYVVNEKSQVVSRPIKMGALHDGLREITDGLKPGDRIIVHGLQLVRPGITVEPKLVVMPTPPAKSYNSKAQVAKSAQEFPIANP